MLEPRQLNETDAQILDFLASDGGRATPSWIASETGNKQAYVSQRLKRLKEHGHLEQPHRGLWQLVDDPRGGASVSDELIETVDSVEWSDQVAKTPDRVRALADVTDVIRDRGEVSPAVLRRHVLRRHDLDMSENSIQRLLSDTRTHLPDVEQTAGGQLYRWTGPSQIDNQSNQASGDHSENHDE